MNREEKNEHLQSRIYTENEVEYLKKLIEKNEIIENQRWIMYFLSAISITMVFVFLMFLFDVVLPVLIA